MLVTNISHAEGNDYLNSRLRKAYDFLSRGDLLSLPVGRVDIDGDEVFANVQEYETVPSSEKHFEAHRRYYDVQFVVCGEELMQYAPLENAVEVQSFDAKNDFGLYEASGAVTDVAMHSGDLSVLAPEDAHKPGCSLGETPSKFRKIVVKVKA